MRRLPWQSTSQKGANEMRWNRMRFHLISFRSNMTAWTSLS